MAPSSLTSRLLRSPISGVIDEINEELENRIANPYTCFQRKELDENNEELETGPLICTPVLEISWR